MPAGPLSGAAAWLGPEPAHPDDWIVRLGAEDIAEFDAAVGHCWTADLTPGELGGFSVPGAGLSV